jgi:hypothetical protein
VIYAVLALGCCQALVLVCFALLARRWYNRERDRILDELSAAVENFVKSPDDKTPSPLALLLDQAALLFAARLAQQLKAMLSGVESGESKSEQLAMFEGAAAQNPLVGILGAILPKRIRNKLLSNPQMIGALGRLGGGAPGGGDPGGGNHGNPGLTRKRRD